MFIRHALIRLVAVLILFGVAGCSGEGIPSAAVPGHREQCCGACARKDGYTCICKGMTHPNPPERPRITLPYLVHPPEIDANLDDAAWEDAAGIPLAYPFGRLEAVADECMLRMGWSYRGIFVAFRSADAGIRARQVPRDGAVWEGDCLEVFLDPQDRGCSYYEIAVSPRGSFYDYLILPRRTGRSPAREPKWTCEGLEFEVTSSEGGWQAEMFLPFHDFSTALDCPPDEEPSWRGHVGVMDRDRGSFRASDIFPVTGAHHPESFGLIAFDRTALREQEAADHVASGTLLEELPGEPVDLAAAKVYSRAQGEFSRGRGYPSAPAGYGRVQPIEAFIAQRAERGKEYPSSGFPLPGCFLIHPADFEDPVIPVLIHADPTLVEFSVSGLVTVYFRKSPVTMVEGSPPAVTKGDGVGVALHSDTGTLFDRWTRSALWRAVQVNFGSDLQKVTLEINSGPAGNAHDLAEIAVYVQ